MLWKILNGVIYSCGVFFCIIVVPACVYAYIFIIMPAQASMEKQQEAETQTMIVSYTQKDYIDNSNGDLNDLFDHLRDSLRNEGNEFAQGLPDGSILFLQQGDYVAVVFQYNMDCGCPLESNKFDALCFSIDFTVDGPCVGEYVIYEGIPLDGYFQIPTGTETDTKVPLSKKLQKSSNMIAQHSNKRR